MDVIVKQAVLAPREIEVLQPRFIKHLDSVTKIADKTYEFKATIPGQSEVITWQIGVIADEIKGQLECRSLPDSEIETLVTLQLKDGGKFGTEVYIHFFYEAPANSPTKAVNLFLSSIAGKEWLKENLKDFKRIIETGEIPTIEDQPSGKQ